MRINTHARAHSQQTWLQCPYLAHLDSQPTVGRNVHIFGHVWRQIRKTVECRSGVQDAVHGATSHYWTSEEESKSLIRMSLSAVDECGSVNLEIEN